MAEAPNRLSLSDAAARIRAGDLTAEALMAACLARIAEREGEVGAWVRAVDAERAMAQARAADRSAPAGPLHGVPIGVKDIIDTHDFPTGLGFAPYAERRPTWDGACVALARRAGAIVLGKTVTTEFAFFSPGKTRNPHDLARTPGGSSSGSAAAVADFMVPMAFGSQTAASVTRPAAFCGVVGYKASLGDFSLSGIRPFAESFDSLGVLTRSARDLGLVRDILLARPSPPLVALHRPRIGLVRGFHWGAMDEEAQALTRAAAAALAEAGARVEEVHLPDAMASLPEAHRTAMAYETARNYAFEQDVHAQALSPQFAQLCAAGAAVPRADYQAALAQFAAGRIALQAAFAGYDALLAPAALGPAPLASEGTGDPIMSRLWTALGGPSVCLPIGRTAAGLPIGAQFVGPIGTDDQIIAVSAWAEPHLTFSHQPDRTTE